MPIFLEPNQSFVVCLESDKSKPLAVRPVFIAKSQNMRGQLQICKTLDRIHEEGLTIEQMFSEVVEMLCTCLIGWRNMGDRELNTETLRDVLMISEARELLRAIAHHQEMNVEEKKS